MEKQRVAIRRRRHDDLAGDNAARAIVHDRLLTEAGREPLRNEAGDEIACATDRRSDNAQRSRRELLRIQRAAERGRADRQSRDQATQHRIFSAGDKLDPQVYRRIDRIVRET
jgi:hypothetical protein